MQKSEKTLLSIIVPIYNSEKTLSRCISSILNQTLNEFELVLVNDGSIDSSESICLEYASVDDRIRYFAKKNEGLVATRKYGLTKATGNYIGFVDSDDWIESCYYENMMNHIISNNADVAISNNFVDYDKRHLQIAQGISYGVYDKKKINELIIPNLIYQSYGSNLGVSPSLCTKVIRKSILETALEKVPNNVRCGEDAASTYPMYTMINKLVFFNDCCGYHYIISGKSMSHFEAIDIEGTLELIDYFTEVFLKSETSDCIKTQITMYCMDSMIRLVRMWFQQRKCYSQSSNLQFKSKLAELDVWDWTERLNILGKKDYSHTAEITWIRSGGRLKWFFLVCDAEVVNAKYLLKRMLGLA